MCIFVRGLKDYLLSYLRASGFRNTELIKFYIRWVLATGYRTYNFLKYFIGSGVTRACILNTNSRKNRREYCSRKPKKRRRKEERLSFSKPKIERI